MALPAYASDLAVYNDATSATGWTELSAYNGAGTPSADTDLAIHGSTCISQDRAKTTRDNSIVYDGAAPTIPTDGVFMAWFKFLAPNSLATLANGGIGIYVGSTVDNALGWWIGGNDTYPYGGWVNYAIDPTIGSADDTLGTGVGDNSLIGFALNLLAAPSKGAPFTVDIIRSGRGTLEFTLGDGTTPATFDGFALVNDHPTATTGRLGLFQDVGGSYLYKGKMMLGIPATACEFVDANVNITIDDTTHVSTAFNRIEVHHVDTNVTWTSVNFIKVGALSLGEFEVIDDADVVFTSCSFTGMSTFIFQSKSLLTSCTWRGCGQVDLGTGTFTSCLFTASAATTAVTTATLNDLVTCSFESAGTGHAVELTGTAGSYTWNNELTGYDTGSAGNGVEVTGGSITGDEAIHITATTGTFNITVSTGATVPSVSSAGAIVNVIAGAVDVTINAILLDGTALNAVTVALYAKDATGSLPFEESITVSNSGTTATITHTGHGLTVGEKVLIKGGDQPLNRGVHTIVTVADANTYTYTMTGTPGGNPTGCTSTWTAIYETLGATNTVTLSKTFSTDQPVVGQVRKSTSAPYYKTAPVTGTVDTDDGLTLTALMLLDE